MNKKKSKKVVNTEMPSNLRKKLGQIVNKYTEELDGEDQKKFKNVMRQVVFEGKTVAEAADVVDKAQVEKIYEIAYNFYNTGNYEEANRILRMLSLIDPNQTKVWHGIAASYHKMGEFQKAVENYFVWSYMDPEDPLPLYFGSDCYIQMDQPKPAVYLLILCMDRCGDNPMYEPIKEKSRHTRDKLMQDVGWEFEEAA